MIIWNDYKYGEEIYRNKSVKTKKWQMKELKTLVLYMLLNNNTLKDIRMSLEECCQDDIRYLTAKQKKSVFDKIISKVKLEIPKKSNIVLTEYTDDKQIIIYQEEINNIKALNDINLEKVAFVLLVYCKWLNNLKWFNISKSDIFNYAKLKNLNSDKQQTVLVKLVELRYLQSEVIKTDKRYRKDIRDGKSQMWSLTYLLNSGDIAFVVDDYFNFVFRYLDYVYGGYFECRECGKIYKKSSNSQEMCADCRKEVTREQTNKRVQKHRDSVNPVTQ